MNRAGARQTRRSDSGAAVGLTQGRELGRAWGCVCFGRENRNRFSRRAGPSIWPSICGSLSRAVRRHPMRRTATRQSSLHSPLAANLAKLRRWIGLNSCDPLGSPASSPSGEAARGSGRQPEPDRIGAGIGCCLCDPTGRAGRTPPHGRDAQRLLLAASTP